MLRSKKLRRLFGLAAPGLLVAMPVGHLVACSDSEPPEQAQDLVAALTPAETDAVLDLVNEASLTLLDDDVALDKRAAENIVAHRDGADATAGTADDDLFDSIDELDAVPWVGPAALDKLVSYAHAQGLVDEPSAGSDEALILGVANTASFEVLDDDVGLDKRAAENIVAHRDGADATAGTADDDPFGTLGELDAIPYVGPAALDSLLDYAKLSASPPCLIISEYIEGQGMNNKAIEIFNCGTTPIPLADYGICLVRNEATSCSVTDELPASTLEPGAVRTICRTKGGTFNDPMQTIVDHCEVEMPGLMTFNGDDRIGIFHDADGDGAFGGDDTITDMLGRFGYQPPVWTWQDLSLRRCSFAPTDGESFYDHEEHFTTHAWGQQEDYGTPPVEGCAAVVDANVFADDLRDALVAHYAQYGSDIAMMGGNDLAAAQAAVDAASAELVQDPEDNPTGYDLADHQIFVHPDVIFPGSDMVWLGVYADGALVAITSFN